MIRKLEGSQLVQRTSWFFTSPSVPFQRLPALLGTCPVVVTDCWGASCFLSGSSYRSCAGLSWLLVTWTQLLQSECLCPPKFICWNPNPKDDSIRGWGLWEVLRSWGWSLTNGISALIKGIPQSSLAPCTLWHSKRHWLWTKKRVLTRMWRCWHIDLGLSSLQNCEKYISAVYKPPSLRYFIIAAWTGKDTNGKGNSWFTYQTMGKAKSQDSMTGPLWGQA